MNPYDYDLFVIGAGSGGVRAARMSAQYGARVAIAEEHRVGGTCVIRGCVPKKLFVYASQFAHSFEDAAGFGWAVENATFDWPALVANKDREIDRLNRLYVRNLEASGVELIEDRAILRDRHTVELTGQGRCITARFILIATGGYPNPHRALPGHELAITSNEAFHLEHLPRSIIVVGGGYIAVEFAGIFAGLGVETTIVLRGERVLRGFDDDLREAVHEAYEASGIRIRSHRVPQRLERDGEGIRASLDNGEGIRAEAVMLALGRLPNTAGLGLEGAGVALGAKGEISVDAYSRTSLDNIYAIGDVTDRVQLTPVAIREGMAFAETVFNGNPTPVDHEMIPTAVFSQPELGTVGLTEAEARARHRHVDIYKSRFRPMKHTLSGRDEKMLMKLVVDGDTGRVLGCHVFGPDAGEMIQLLGIPVKMGATKADFDATVAVHPTAAEELVTMREKWVPAVQAAE